MNYSNFAISSLVAPEPSSGAQNAYNQVPRTSPIDAAHLPGKQQQTSAAAAFLAAAAAAAAAAANATSSQRPSCQAADIVAQRAPMGENFAAQQQTWTRKEPQLVDGSYATFNALFAANNHQPSRSQQINQSVSRLLAEAVAASASHSMPPSTSSSTVAPKSAQMSPFNGSFAFNAMSANQPAHAPAVSDNPSEPQLTLSQPPPLHSAASGRQSVAGSNPQLVGGVNQAAFMSPLNRSAATFLATPLSDASTFPPTTLISPMQSSRVPMSLEPQTMQSQRAQQPIGRASNVTDQKHGSPFQVDAAQKRRLNQIAPAPQSRFESSLIVVDNGPTIGPLHTDFGGQQRSDALSLLSSGGSCGSTNQQRPIAADNYNGGGTLLSGQNQCNEDSIGGRLNEPSQCENEYDDDDDDDGDSCTSGNKRRARKTKIPKTVSSAEMINPKML